MRVIKPFYNLELDLPPDKIRLIIERCGRESYQSWDRTSDTSHLDFCKMIGWEGRKHFEVGRHVLLRAHFVFDRGVSHEFVRHHIGWGMTQESTRYCNYSKDNARFDGHVPFVTPPWLNLPEGIWQSDDNGDWWVDGKSVEVTEEASHWLYALDVCEFAYRGLLAKGWSPQQARGVLPHALKTGVVASGNIEAWRKVLESRGSKPAHPQIVEVISETAKELAGLFPEFFGDLVE